MKSINRDARTRPALPHAGYVLPALISFIVLCGNLSQAFAQAWTKEEGKLYSKISYGTSTASEQYTFDGRQKEYADNVSDNAFFDRSIYLYGELGLTPDLTLVGGLPFKRVIVRDAAFRYRTFAFGNAQIGARYTLNNLLGTAGTSESFAANLALSLPLGYTRNLTPSVGSGQIDAEFNTSWGHSFYPFPAYAQAGLGYRYRSSIYALSTATDCQEGIDKNCFADSRPVYTDDLLGGIEAGVTISNRVLLQGLARVNWSLKEPDVGFTVSNPIPTRQRFLKVGMGIGVAVWQGIGVSGQMFFTPTGLNTVNSTDLFLGIDYTFDAFTPKTEEVE